MKSTVFCSISIICARQNGLSRKEIILLWAQKKSPVSYTHLKAGKATGIHAHNNQQCAFANTIEALSIGVSYLDGTLSGMGRGAGNCALEGLIGFLKNPRYQLDPLLRCIQKDILALKQKGCVWGYDIPYMLTGLLDQHRCV